MSDFDKEAEREKLREKYDQEQEQRETTQRMSELLLQGATMTNRHCDTCGDPVFRYQGQEFCPTCQTEVGDGAADAGAEAGEGATQQTDATTEAGRADASDAADEAAGSQSYTEPEAMDAAEPAEADEPSGETGVGTPRSDTRRETPSASGQSAPSARGTDGSPRAETAPETSDRTRDTAPAGDVEEARAALLRTLTSLAARAEESRDPRQTRDLLSAAREAAETLAELDRVSR